MLPLIPATYRGPAALAARSWLSWLVGLLAACHLLSAFAQPAAAPGAGLLPVPALTDRVLDRTNTLSAQEHQALVQKLAQLESALGSQLVILMVPTTQPEDIAAFAYRVADQWKIGRRNVGDGVLVVVAKNDRRVRIEVARALEGAIPDLAAHQIIERAMTPAFRAGDFAGGLSAGVDQLAARIKGEALPLPEARPAAQPGPQWEDLGIFLFLGVPIAGAVLKGLLGRKLGTVATGAAAGALGWFWTSSLLVAGVAVLGALALAGALGGGGGRGRGPGIWWGGGGGWGGGSGGHWGGGGGFSSGGGGSFGGGGASGNW